MYSGHKLQKKYVVIFVTFMFAKIAEGFIKWILDDITHNIDINKFGNINGISTSHYLINLVHTMFLGSESDTTKHRHCGPY